MNSRFIMATMLMVLGSHLSAAEPLWKKHVVFEGAACLTAVAGDFSGDGRVDVIFNAGRKTYLAVAPDWKRRVLEDYLDINAIHSEMLDVDEDGDLDYIATRYHPGFLYWLEQPKNALQDTWKFHLIDANLTGTHGLLVGEVDGDGRPDLIANSGQPVGPLANSMVWYQVPKKRLSHLPWKRNVFSKGDSPGLSHYMGVGDINGDGRADISAGAKGGPTDPTGKGDWFAWWEAPEDPTAVWKRHSFGGKQAGATNIFPGDINGDGKTDLLASRGHGQGVLWFEAPDWKPHDIHPTLAGPHCLQVADIDLDGDLDAATCAKDDKLCLWFENDGKGKFTTHVVGRDQAAYDIRAVDMDGDKDLDLLVAGQSSMNVVWYENPGSVNGG